MNAEPKSPLNGAQIGQLVVSELVKAIRRDRANRYSLRAPWRLPRLVESIPNYSGLYFHINDGVITTLPYDGDVCDGCTLAPDKIGPWRPVIAAIFHDPWYLEALRMSRAWGSEWPVRRVRAVGDHVFYGILSLVTPGVIARTYYWAVYRFGKWSRAMRHATAIVIVIAMFSAGCSGCASPDSPFEDPGEFVLPDYEQTAGGNQ